jgi:hypothetical protein
MDLKKWYFYTKAYCLVIKKNKIMSFAGKLMELDIIILSEKSQAQKQNITCCHSHAGSKSKMIKITIIMRRVQTGHCWGVFSGKGKGKWRGHQEVKSIKVCDHNRT